jgi:lysophospholipase L1-like esterase
VQFLRSRNLEFVDLLPVLQAANQAQDAYPLTDIHPNSHGYRAVAEEMNRVLFEPAPKK